MKPANVFQPVDDTARALARRLVDDATFAALAVLRPETGLPSVSRIALATDGQGRPITLISALAEHSRALNAHPACALLVGDPGDRGDPLTHPRLTLHCTARAVSRASNEHISLRDRYISQRPKAKLYVDFADFFFLRFDISDGLLNGGFGKAWKLSRNDLNPPDQRTT
ncbi:MAG: HugZ family pyridoxamine 5'-phosphate oxidase [Ruegeria sp.]